MNKGRQEGKQEVSEYIPFNTGNTTIKDNTAAFDSFLHTRLLATHPYLPPSSFLTPVITSSLSPVVRFVMTFWLKGNKSPSFVQFTAGAGSPLTVQINVTLDPICAVWFTGALTIVGIRSSKKEYKNVFLYRQYFYILYQECSSVTIRWTISL